MEDVSRSGCCWQSSVMGDGDEAWGPVKNPEIQIGSDQGPSLQIKPSWTQPRSDVQLINQINTSLTKCAPTWRHPQVATFCQWYSQHFPILYSGWKLETLRNSSLLSSLPPCLRHRHATAPAADAVHCQALTTNGPRCACDCALSSHWASDDDVRIGTVHKYLVVAPVVPRQPFWQDHLNQNLILAWYGTSMAFLFTALSLTLSGFVCNSGFLTDLDCCFQLGE